MKKMNLLNKGLLIILSLVSLIARAQNTELTGQLKGLAGGTIKIGYIKAGTFESDSVRAVNDVFSWKVNFDAPQLVSLVVDNHSYSYFLSLGSNRLTGIKDSVETYRLSGSEMQRDAEEFSGSIKDLTDQLAVLSASYSKASAPDKVLLDRKRDDLQRQKEIRTVQFITDHPRSFFSIYMINKRTAFGTDYTKIKALYDKLDGSAKLTVPGKKLGEKLELLLKSRIGTQMTDFTQTDVNGNPVRFSSFNGKYVLVDFWASWCAPCRAENPNVLKAYNTYKDKGFTVIGISLDDKAANWKKAINDDKMPWTQLSDLKGWKNSVATDFGIQSIPSNLLIDPSGKIVARDIRGAALENKLKQLLD
jgi:peroxiredoxin